RRGRGLMPEAAHDQPGSADARRLHRLPTQGEVGDPLPVERREVEAPPLGDEALRLEVVLLEAVVPTEEVEALAVDEPAGAVLRGAREVELQGRDAWLGGAEVEPLHL